MSTGATTVGLRRLARTKTERWRQPLFRSGHLLVASSTLTAAIGVGYWVAAARRYPPDVVGRNAAAISAMMFLAGCAQLNLMSALLRFLPTSGAAAHRMIARAYLLGGGLSLLAGAVFVVGAPLWAPELVGLVHRGTAAPALFVVATGCAAIFVMQDNVLVGLGRPTAVPIENLGFAVFKLALVVVLAPVATGTGIWLSWSIALVAAAVATTAYLDKRAVPEFVQQATDHPEVVSVRDLVRFIGPDYVGSLCWIASTTLVPVLVLGLAGPGAAAAFALPWAICLATFHVPAAFGQSLVAVGAREPERLAAHYRQLRRHTLHLLLPVVAALVVSAPWLLTTFGDWYAGEGSTTLQLLALSVLPNAIVSLAISRARVERRTGEVAAYLIATGTVVVGLTLVMVPRIGVTGVGVAWLVAETSLAAVVLAREIKGVGRSPHRRDVTDALARLPGDAEVERVLPSRSDTTVVLLGDSVLRTSRTRHGAAALRREHEVLGRLFADSRIVDWRRLLPCVLEAGDRHLLTSRIRGTARPAVTPAEFAAAVAEIRCLHLRTGHLGTLDNRWLDQAIEPAASTVAEALPSARQRRALDRLTAELRATLAGRTAWLGWTHGDFHPGNVLYDGGRVSGIVDWDQATEDGLAALDLVLWLLTATPNRRQLGAQVVDRLRRDRAWSEEEARLLGAQDPAIGRAYLLLGWLRHAAGNFGKSERYAASPLWLRRNVLPVLREASR